MIVYGLALYRENGRVGLQQVLALHARAAGAGAYQQGVVGILETGIRVVGADDARQQGKSAVFQFHSHAFQRFHCGSDIQQVQNDGLVVAEHGAGSDTEQQGVANLACRAGNGNSNGLFHRIRFLADGRVATYGAHIVRGLPAKNKGAAGAPARRVRLDWAGAERVHCAPETALAGNVVQELSRKEKTRFNKLQKSLRRNVGNAIADYNMIEQGDRVMVCLSGGKDSYGMLDILLSLQHSAPVDFELIAVNLDQKQPGFPEEVLPAYLSALDIPFYILEKDTYSVVREVIPEGKTTCGLCSRLRRGSLYGFAREIGATKIALGHHRDDIVETLFLNMFFAGKLKAMPPKLLSDDRQNVVIRPLAYCREKDLARYAAYRQFPIIPCNLCGSQENLQRVQIKQMLAEWERAYPGRTEIIFRSIRNVAPSQLADTGLFDFSSLRVERDAGEIAEDRELYFPAINVVNL